MGVDVREHRAHAARGQDDQGVALVSRTGFGLMGAFLILASAIPFWALAWAWRPETPFLVVLFVVGSGLISLSTGIFLLLNSARR